MHASNEKEKGGSVRIRGTRKTWMFSRNLLKRGNRAGAGAAWVKATRRATVVEIVEVFILKVRIGLMRLVES